MVPGWYLLLGIGILFLSPSLYPGNANAMALCLFIASLGNCVREHRSFQNIPDHPPETTDQEEGAIVRVLRYLGANSYRIDKNLNHIRKSIVQIRFDVKVSTGMHKIWFVARKDGKTSWLDYSNKISAVAISTSQALD